MVRLMINDSFIELDLTKTLLELKKIVSGGAGRGIYKPGMYKPIQKKSTFDHTADELEMNKDPEFNLESMDDFPALVSMGRGKNA